MESSISYLTVLNDSGGNIVPTNIVSFGLRSLSFILMLVNTRHVTLVIPRSHLPSPQVLSMDPIKTDFRGAVDG